MMRRAIIQWLTRCTALGILVLHAGPIIALEVPFLRARVNDLAEILSPEAEARIEGRLAALEQVRGAQIAVLTIPSLEGDSLEAFSVRVAETWALGRADEDDGALLLISRDDRKMRIEVGYGLEHVLTDAYSGRILDQVIRPRFRAGDFDGGVERASETMAAVVEGNDTLPPPNASAPAGGSGRVGGFAFFLLMIAPFALSAISSRGCGSWILYLLLMPIWYAVPALALGSRMGIIFLLAWAIGFPILHLLLARKGTSWLSRGARGWSSSRGWGGGGGFSGGGFSGGGGSFGGGGASSSW